MCITPETSGVRLQTVVGTNKGIDELVIPDGVSRPITDAECKGTEQAEWSNDGARVFRSTDVTCGKEAARTIKTMAFLAPGPSWINVQHVSGAAANASVRVQRYRRAANQKLADGSTAHAARRQDRDAHHRRSDKWSIEDVIEASAKVPAEAVQAALSEVHHGFDLNKRTLVALDEGGVQRIGHRPDGRAHLSEASSSSNAAAAVPRRPASRPAPAGSIRSCPAEWRTSAMDCYSPFGYGYRSYYSMCGARTLLAVRLQLLRLQQLLRQRLLPLLRRMGRRRPVPAGDRQHNPAEPQVEGRVVNGRGYTQIRNRESEPSPRISGGGNGGGWSGSGGGGVSSGGYSAGSSSGGSSGGGGAVPSGGDSGARVAVPKGGGQ